MPKVEFQPEELADPSASFLLDPEKAARYDEIFQQLSTLNKQEELKVYIGHAARYVALGGDDEEFLRLAQLMPEEGAKEAFPDDLQKLQDLKKRHPELFS
jgi:hypothetical protein